MTVNLNNGVTRDGVLDLLWVLPPVEEEWDTIAGLPVDPAVGDRYISDGTAYGWEDGHIYEWDGTEWIETVPEEGFMVWLLFELVLWVFFSGGWMEMGEYSWLRLDGSNANSDIDIGAYNFSTTGIIRGTSDLYTKHAVYSDTNTHTITSTTIPWAVTFNTVETQLGPTLGKTSEVTISNASPAVISWASHGLYVDSPVVFTTDGELPSGLTAGTTYYIIAAGFGVDSFQVSATPQGAAINTTTDGSGTHTATNTSVITVDVAGCYGFIFSTLCSASSAGTTFDIWFRKNGVNMARSNTRTEVANANNVIVSVADIVENLAAGDKVEMFWVSDSTNGQLLAVAEQANPTRPATPSTILTVKKLSRCA